MRLKGPKGNPEAAGARVTVYEAGKLGEAGAILGYQENIFSTDFRMPRPLHFGLGGRANCDVRVQFPGGQVATQCGVASGHVAIISTDKAGNPD